jgi:hypothetical protein
MRRAETTTRAPSFSSRSRSVQTWARAQWVPAARKAQLLHQHVGRGGQQHSELVGPEAAAAGMPSNIGSRPTQYSEVQSSMFGAMTTTEISISDQTPEQFDLLLAAELPGDVPVLFLKSYRPTSRLLELGEASAEEHHIRNSCARSGGGMQDRFFQQERAPLARGRTVIPRAQVEWNRRFGPVGWMLPHFDILPEAVYIFT